MVFRYISVIKRRNDTVVKKKIENVADFFFSEKKKIVRKKKSFEKIFVKKKLSVKKFCRKIFVLGLIFFSDFYISQLYFVYNHLICFCKHEQHMDGKILKSTII